ncbi:HutD family protein [Sphingopyxis soli]|uniref:HutD family protein n=1 Tax=Sphingopyxis soli TaxID=592051 RepID=A0ABN1MCA4_9SPHN|nr:HutD family protein [Sphingopyxis soli]
MAGGRLLRAKDRVARPWKNGGGVTRDIMVFPDGAGDADFLWRASIATIEKAGPFSAFPGVDRAFLLLRGDLLIDVGDRGEQRLHPGSPALLFGGEEAVRARPLGGPCSALNIMTRRGRASAILERWSGPKAADRLLLLATGTAPVTVGADTIHLAKDDALLIDRAGDSPPSADAPLVAAFIRDQLVQ